jgi:hypothetical protein
MYHAKGQLKVNLCGVSHNHVKAQYQPDRKFKSQPRNSRSVSKPQRLSSIRPSNQLNRQYSGGGHIQDLISCTRSSPPTRMFPWALSPPCKLINIYEFFLSLQTRCQWRFYINLQGRHHLMNSAMAGGTSAGAHSSPGYIAVIYPPSVKKEGCCEHDFGIPQRALSTP